MSHVPYIPENAPFNARQRLWLNGYLAGIFATASLAVAGDDAAAGPAVPLLILFGSQTGTAEGLARRVAKEAKSKNVNARVVDASITWNYTTRLNIAFLILAAVLVWRFFRTGGLAMLRMMNKPAAMGHSH